ncbi:MAG: NADH-quinone oxidoreductase subunit NuoN [Actinomycetales bacterium]|nr:NADH-quinone oxidoreductase subunit NuoN [Actinomycetales bacterium]
MIALDRVLPVVERPDIPAPIIEYGPLMPLIIVFAVAMLGLIVEITFPRGKRFVAQVVVAVAGLSAALVSVVLLYSDLPEVESQLVARGEIGGVGSVAIDGPGVVTWGLILIFSILSMLLFADRTYENGLSVFTGRAADAPGSKDEAEATAARLEHTEVFPLAVFAVVGMMLFAVSHDLITMFVALEVLSLPLYVIAGLARRRRLISQEAALKYFLLGAFASAFFLYGAALAYGFSGSLRLTEINHAISSRDDAQAMILGSIALLAVGLLFKIGAVPFHSWTPDVYQGAPTPVTAFMASATKVAAFVALMRVFFVAFGGAAWDWRPVIWVIAVVTMLIGSVVAIAQTDIKRMLAYSSIAHAGFALVGFSGAYVGGPEGNVVTSVSAVLFYMLAYGLATIGAFAVVMVVRDSSGETTELARWAGLGKHSPWLAAAVTIYMLSFMGIPLTAGFIGKWAVFSAAWAGGAWLLVVIAVLLSAVAAVFYLRVVVLMYFTEPAGEGPTVARASYLTTVVIAVTVIGTIGLGVLPGPAIELIQHAGAFVR